MGAPFSAQRFTRFHRYRYGPHFALLQVGLISVLALRLGLGRTREFSSQLSPARGSCFDVDDKPICGIPGRGGG